MFGYNTLLVLFACALLGAAAGVVGGFVMLRRQILAADAGAHCAMPGVAIAFLAMLALTGEGRWPLALLLGGLGAGALGLLTVHWLVTATRLSRDTAMAATLAGFFGLGVVLFSHIQTLPAGGQAGLNAILLGQAATLNRAEAGLIAICALIAVAGTLALYKELRLLAFDPVAARAQGWPVARLDLALTFLMLLLAAAGLKAVGLVLFVALMVLPAASARLLTTGLAPMLGLAALLGASAAAIGALASARIDHLPAGPAMVLAGAALFAGALARHAMGRHGRGRA